MHLLAPTMHLLCTHYVLTHWSSSSLSAGRPGLKSVYRTGGKMSSLGLLLLMRRSVRS